jgi:hypothetical protein
VFDLNARATSFSDSRQFASGTSSAAERAKFVTEISKNWDEALASKFASGAATFIEYFSGDAAIANAIADVEQRFASCDPDGADAALRRTIGTARSSIDAARTAMRDSEREMRCIERGWRKQYGEGWRQAVALDGGGIAGQAYAPHQAQLQRLGDGEPERLARLDRAAVLCATAWSSSGR